MAKLFDDEKNMEPKATLESMMKRGIMDERDVDYLNHLQIPEASEIAVEGILRATIHDSATVPTDAYREIKGWFLGMESKRKYIEEICTDIVDWLKDKQANEGNLDLDMGSFKTWMKTSETFFWRYFFLLDDENWHRIETNLKAGRITNIEVLENFDMKDRTRIAQLLDSITEIKGLIKMVELYITRSNKFFELILKRKVKVKMFPFQVILLGATDLRRTIKKIVNLAI